MGQSKSKTWRRLSESDCLQLLNDDSDELVSPIFQHHQQQHSQTANTFRSNIDPSSVPTNKRWSICVNLPEKETDENALVKFPKSNISDHSIKHSTYTKNNSNFVLNNHLSHVNYRPNQANNVPMIRNTLNNGAKCLEPIVNNHFSLIDPSKQYTLDTVNDSLAFPNTMTNNRHNRPISMFQFEPNLEKSNGGKKASLRLSLTDLLDRINSFDSEDDGDFSNQTLTPDDQDDKMRSLEEDDDDEKTSTNTNSPLVRCTGLDCMCERCVNVRFKLLNWLLPNCTRINAERLLSGRLDGTFLVRKSEKFPGQYTLSFVCKRSVRHCLIMRSVYGFGLRWPYSFETLQQVIIHYTKNSLSEFNSKLDVLLRYPVFMA